MADRPHRAFPTNPLYISALRKRPAEREDDDAAYPFSLPAIRHLTELRFSCPVVFLVGENGTGKSTLIEAIAVQYGFNPEGGSRNFRFDTRNTHSDLYRRLILSKGVKAPKDGYFLRAESFYNVASEIERLDEVPSFDPPVIGGYGGRSLHEQSHGESFLSLMLHRFFGRGLYILDEPEAALSPSRQMTLLARIDQLIKQDSQFIIATHSPILMAYPDAEIFVLSETGIARTPYRETEHYLITKQFLLNPEAMMRHLLEE